jgi:hypothetical protein
VKRSAMQRSLKDFYFAFIKEGNTPLCDASAPLGFALRNAYKAASCVLLHTLKLGYCMLRSFKQMWLFWNALQSLCQCIFLSLQIDSISEKQWRNPADGKCTSLNSFAPYKASQRLWLSYESSTEDKERWSFAMHIRTGECCWGQIGIK